MINKNQDENRMSILNHYNDPDSQELMLSFQKSELILTIKSMNMTKSGHIMWKSLIVANSFLKN